MADLAGRVFLVTGASSGIGLAIAHALVKSNAKVALMARGEAALQALRTEWNAPERTLVTAGDVTSEADCRAAVEATVAAFGRLDGLIHSAGISSRGLVGATSPEVFRRLMEVNYFSCVSLIQAALPHLRASRGHVAVISSVTGKLAPPLRGAYAASKHAVQGLLGALRVEEHDAGVHVLAVCPGYVRTEISRNALAADGSRYGRMDEDTANGLDPEWVAGRVLAALVHRKREIAPAGRLESLGLVLARYAPWLLDRVLLRIFHRVPAEVLALAGKPLR